MSTQKTEPTPRTRDHRDTNETIRWTVRGLAAGRGWTIDQVATRVGIGRSTLHTRTRDKAPVPFHAWEVYALADLFGVPVGDLYDGLGGRFGPGSGSSAGISASRHLTLLPGVSSPPHGSNRAWQPPLLAVVGG